MYLQLRLFNPNLYGNLTHDNNYTAILIFQKCRFFTNYILKKKSSQAKISTKIAAEYWLPAIELLYIVSSTRSLLYKYNAAGKAKGHTRIQTEQSSLLSRPRDNETCSAILHNFVVLCFPAYFPLFCL